MKITPEDLKEIQELVKPQDTPERRTMYATGNFPRANLVKDLNMRYRWDLVYMTDPQKRTDWFTKVYQYANDDHVDTALRSFIPALET